MRLMSSDKSPTPQTAPRWVWQQPDWPAFAVDAAALAPALDAARLEQGRLLGQLQAIGLQQAQDVCRDIWIEETLATAAIEGEALDLLAVRSSVAHRLGLAEPTRQLRHVDALVLVMQDAHDHHALPLDEERLCRWQAALFPTGISGLQRIAVGRYRNHADPMQIVSGRQGREVVHYEAPPSQQVPAQMARFLDWFARTHPARAQAGERVHGLVRAALAHLWFESIHPFEDGNGRIGRAIVDMALSQDMGAPARVFGLSRQMQAARRDYYGALNAAQRGTLDVTTWVQWFVQTFTASCARSQAMVQQALAKAAFWHRVAQHSCSERQQKVLRKLVEAGDGGFEGGMSADKYSKITQTSKPTATRDLAHLARLGLLLTQGQGKATRYGVNVEGWNAK